MTGESERSTKQRTLAGDTTIVARQRPRTFVYCLDCDSWLLRRKRLAHPCRPYDAFVAHPEDADPLEDAINTDAFDPATVLDDEDDEADGASDGGDD